MYILSYVDEKTIKWSWIVVPLYLLCQSNNERHFLQKANHIGRLRAKPLWEYSGHKMRVIGQVIVHVKYGSQKKNFHCSLWLENEDPHC